MNAQPPLKEALYWTESFPVGPLACNCSIVANLATKKAVVIDPGGDAELILAKLKAKGLELVAIWHTHAHFDHFLASGELHEATGAPLGLHAKDRNLWKLVEVQCRLFGAKKPKKPLPLPSIKLEAEQTIELGDGLTGMVIFTPGHTPGSCSFHWPKLKLLCAGDTLFNGSVGRTDLWGGNFDTLKRSIQSQLYVLDEATQVIAGHGPPTTIGQECRHNSIVTALKGS